MTSHRTPITLAAISVACALLAFSGRAHAQLRAADVECRKTETQAECFKRLKCKADEELEACQKRLLKCNAGENLDDCKKRVGNGGGANQNQNQGNQGGNRADERTGREQENRERDNGDRGDQDRAQREREREEREREERDRDNNRGDRGNRDEDSGRERSRRGGGGDGGSRGRRRRGGGGGGGGGFEANKTFGLGLELGEPSGLNGKVFVSHNVAIDFGVGYIYDHYYYRGGQGLHVYGDLLFHPVVLAHADAFELPLYVGPGIRFWDFRYCDNRVCYDDGSAFGIRVPIGIDFDFNNVPLDIFVQFVPVLDFLYGGYYDRYPAHREHFGVDFSAGIRFWFK